MKEVVNIISDSYSRGQVGGPNKVILNTLKGFDLINQPYVLNRCPENYKYNWVHDSKKALIEIAVKKIPAILGPNLVVLPRDLPSLLPDINHCVYLHPSDWCVDLWKRLGYTSSKIFSWPAGIDTSQFCLNREKINPKQVLVYFKRRNPDILSKVKKSLIAQGFEPKEIIYGSYTESDFIETIGSSLFGVWITISESQGIALQETLSSGCPLLVLDVKSLFETGSGTNYVFPDSIKDFRPTSAPYFDSLCGIIIDDLDLLDEKIKEMASEIERFNPREFIIENLSLEAMAEKLLSFFNLLDLETLSSKDHTNNKPFRMSSKSRLIYLTMILNRKYQTVIGTRWAKS